MDPTLYKNFIQKLQTLEGRVDAFDKSSLNTISEEYDRNQKKKVNEFYNKIVNIDTYLFNKKIKRVFKPFTRDMYATIYLTIWVIAYISAFMNFRKF